MKIKAAVCRELLQPLVLEEVDLADPQDDEVLVRIAGCGICHTDIIAQENGWGGMNPMPMIFGHEGSGIIEKIGPGVKDFAVGDHVVISYPYCGECVMCKSGQPQNCINNWALVFSGLRKDGTSPISKDGETIHYFFGQSSFATFSITSVRNIVKVDQDINLAMLGPLGCGMMTGAGTLFNKLKPAPNSSIVIFGAGGVGLSSVMAAKICNCKTIIVVDVVENRLKLALDLGATHVINAKSISDVPNEVVKIIGQGADYMVETTGLESTTKDAIHSLGFGGEGALVAVANHVEFDNFYMSIYGKKLHTITMGEAITQEIIPKLIDLYKRGLFPFDKLIKYYEFENINQALADAKSGAVIKPVLKMNS